MRWNCPHCGTQLAVADEKVGSGWSFSRCYKCAGYGLVRRSDVTLIKVDRAPEGEPVLLPEAHENATTMLSDTATRNLNRYTSGANASSTASNMASVSVTGASKPVVRTSAHRTAQTPSRQTQAAANFGLPEPLPAIPAQRTNQRFTPMAIGLAGILTICSGIYLYVQGQELFERARTQAKETSQPAAPEALSSNTSLDEPAPEIVMAPDAPTTLSATSLADAAAAANPNAPVVMDEVHARAMAPTRDRPANSPARTSKRK